MDTYGGGNISWPFLGAVLAQLIKLNGRDQLVDFLGSPSLHDWIYVSIHLTTLPPTLGQRHGLGIIGSVMYEA